MQESGVTLSYSQIVEEIERRGLPMEIALLLPMVESTYNPNAYSREHAVGLWQFVGATGARALGLQQDWWFDGRRDPLQASTDRRSGLYGATLSSSSMQDWLLAIAAYNTGRWESAPSHSQER